MFVINYLDGVDDVVAVQADPQLVDSGLVDILQSAEQPAIQVEPVLHQPQQVETLDELLQLIDDLVHLWTPETHLINLVTIERTSVHLLVQLTLKPFSLSALISWSRCFRVFVNPR